MERRSTQPALKDCSSPFAATARVSSLFAYPVKSLSAQPLPGVTLSPGAGVPGDRLWALGRSEGNYRPGNSARLPKDEFHVLVRDSRLAGVQTSVSEGHVLSVKVGGHQVLTADLATNQGKRAVSTFFSRLLDCPAGAEPIVAAEPDIRFTDKAWMSHSMMEAVSIINLASVRALEQRAHVRIDPLRFRANIYIDGLPAFSELDLVGSELGIGSTKFTVAMNTLRCAATSVNRVNARRDVPIPQLLMQHFGHSMMGIYGEVVTGGTIRSGDAVSYYPGRPRL